MYDEFEKLLCILKYAVFGKETNMSALCVNESTLDLATQQDVLPLVYAAVAKDATIADKKKYEGIFFSQIMQSEQQMFYLRKIVNEFEKNNISYCVLKGSSVAPMYHLCDYRISGDVDILIEPQDEKAVMKLLETSLKMAVTPRSKDGHHFLAQDGTGVLFEMHIALYNSSFNDLVLENIFDEKHPCERICVKDDLCINTLSVTDNLHFLTAHLIKHFVKEGCGIRQITDLLAFVEKTRDRIDFEVYFEKLKKINFDVLIKNIFGIGEIYFSLNLPYAETEYVSAILEDIQNGGSFGFSEKERTGFFDNFLINRTKADEKRYALQKSSKQALKILKGVFLPSRSFLISKGYLYLKKSILFYPVAYVHRIINAFSLLVQKKRSVKDFKFKKNENKTLSGRMKLMKSLQIFGGEKK